MSENKLKVFENKQIRTIWNEAEEEWYFSVVDVVAVLTDSINPTDYLKKMRKRDELLGEYIGTNCPQVEMYTESGKLRKTLAANTKQILRIVQSIPSPKAEPFKVWLAQVGSERLDEIADPEKAFARGADFYRAKGYPEEWITQRMMSIKIRKELTDEWRNRGIEKDKDYAILTDEMTRAWSGLSVREYKDVKGLKKESLRDNMTDLELIFNMLAEATTTTLSKQENPQGLDENRRVAQKGGDATRRARQSIEDTIGKPVVSPLNAGNKPALAITHTTIHKKGGDANEEY